MEKCCYTLKCMDNNIIFMIKTVPLSLLYRIVIYSECFVRRPFIHQGDHIIDTLHSRSHIMIKATFMLTLSIVLPDLGI